MRVCILGCGPAGLLSAYAAVQKGHRIMIYSKKIKSSIPGAVFLHEPIPHLTAPDPDGVVKFIKHGTKEGYAAKVYGHEDAECSWDLFPEGERPAWSMNNLYDRLWRLFEVDIRNEIIGKHHTEFMPQLFDLTISTIPVPHICHDSDHEFHSQSIHVINKCVDPTLENGIVYNGSHADNWYRTSRLFGSEATESVKPFTNGDAPPDAVVSLGSKPLHTDCDCHPEIKRVGRYGRWEKGILVHHAYKQTVQLLEER